MSQKKDDRATVKAARINYRGRVIAAIITLIGMFGIYILQKSEPTQTPDKEDISLPTKTIDKDDIKSNKKELEPETKTAEKTLEDNGKTISKSEKKKPQPKREPGQKAKNTEPISTPATTHIDKIGNSGNLSIGQTGGTVNQTTIINPKPQPRHMTEEIMKILQDSIPDGYSVDVMYPMTDEESTTFAIEMLTVLHKLGYKTTYSIYGQIAPDLNQSYYIRVKKQEEKAEITIYKLK